MLILKIAFRNIFRNARRSLTTLMTIAIGVAAVLTFGAYVTYIIYGVQTGAVQRTGHLQVFRDGYFTFGAASPGAWGIDNYQRVLDLIQDDPQMKEMAAVITPQQSLFGIAGNFEKNNSKTFFGVGFVPSQRDRMKQWDEYGTGSQGLRHAGLKDDDLSTGIAGVGLVRILGMCEQLHLADCPVQPKLPDDPEESTSTAPTVDIGDLAKRDQLPSGPANSQPTIDLLAATAGGAPNVVGMQISKVEIQPLKELDDNYVGMNLGLAQNLIYGRGEHKITGIVVQLKRTEYLKAAHERLNALIKEHGLNLEVRDFTELNSQYNQVIALFRSIFSFITVVISVVVLFTVSNAMGMSVIERTGEIGTTRAMGVRRTGIRRQFLVEGLLLGVVGSTLGVIIGYIAAFAINHAGLTWTPPAQAAPIPLRLYMAGAYSLIVLTWSGLIAVSALASLVPASRAARLEVVDALRFV